VKGIVFSVVTTDMHWYSWCPGILLWVRTGTQTCAVAFSQVICCWQENNSTMAFKVLTSWLELAYALLSTNASTLFL